MKQITEHIYLIQAPFFQFPYCNCLVVKDDRTCLMDSAMMTEHLNELLSGIHIDLVLNSHAHMDHVHQNHRLSLPIYWHPAEDIWVESPDSFLQAFGFSRFGQEELGRVFMALGGWKSRLPDGHFEPGDIIDLGRNRVEIMHLPGHTPGHCGFFFLDEGILFSADIDLTGFGPFYGNVVSSIDDFIKSLDYLIELQPDMIITGHGDGVVKHQIRQRLRTFRDIIFRREEDLLSVLKKMGKVTLRELAGAKTIYRRKNTQDEELFIMMEMLMDELHLERLIREGRAVQEGDYFAAIG